MEKTSKEKIVEWEKMSLVKWKTELTRAVKNENCDRKEGACGLDAREIVKKKLTKERLKEEFVLQEIKWRQRSKVKELKEGETLNISI